MKKNSDDFQIFTEILHEIGSVSITNLCVLYARIKRYTMLYQQQNSNSQREEYERLLKKQELVKELIIREVMKENGYIYTEDIEIPQFIKA